jgi:hypothetical protein
LSSSVLTVLLVRLKLGTAEFYITAPPPLSLGANAPSPWFTFLFTEVSGLGVHCVTIAIFVGYLAVNFLDSA